MTALTKDVVYQRHGSEPDKNRFGYPVAPNEVVYRGSLIALNASNQIVRVQTAGAVTFLGIANKQLNNVGNASPSTGYVEGLKGTWSIPVPGVTQANGATVYAVDDGTVSLTNTGSLFTVGVLAGIDVGTGKTFVTIVGS